MKLSDLKSLVGRKPDKIPTGWKTVEQWANEECMSRKTTSVLIQQALEKGLIERRDFLVRKNVVRPIPHYRIKEPAKNP
jgi:hypothetical protein